MNRKLVTVGVVIVALCLAFVSAPRAFASAGTPALWIGSPVNGTWPSSAGCPGTPDSCSLPSIHHVVYYNPLQNGGSRYIDDFAMDFQGVHVGDMVMVVASPLYSGEVSSVSARVETVGPACVDYNYSDGGSRVSVALYVNGYQRVGTLTYAHINPAVGITQGTWINPWRTVIGYVGSYNWNGCWQGAHVHFEALSTQNYACYSSYWQPSQAITQGNFFAYVGGNYASYRQQAC